MRHTFKRSTTPMDLSELRAIVPAAFSERASSEVSKRYQFLSTESIMNELRIGGLGCYSAKQSGNRIQGRENFARHELRFRSINRSAPVVGGMLPEIIIRNSHDARGGSYLIETGFFRFVCANGAVVSIGTAARTRVMHIFSSIDAVMLAVQNNINEVFPLAIDTVERFTKIELSWEKQTELAELALGLRYPEKDKRPFEAARLLEINRDADREPTLWNIYNRIQENLTQGQARRNATERTSRRVTSIDVDMKINRGLWELAEQFA